MLRKTRQIVLDRLVLSLPSNKHQHCFFHIHNPQTRPKQIIQHLRYPAGPDQKTKEKVWVTRDKHPHLVGAMVDKKRETDEQGMHPKSSQPCHITS